MVSAAVLCKPVSSSEFPVLTRIYREKHLDSHGQASASLAAAHVRSGFDRATGEHAEGSKQGKKRRRAGY